MLDAAPPLAPHARSQPAILARLREDTAEHHARLENDLDLLRQPVEAGHMRAVLARFHGFHAEWEPAMRRALDDEPDLIVPRLRLPALVGDLLALGATEADIRALPVDDEAGHLPSSLPAALGSLYVVEGSALGGQLISRALATERWLPQGGLRFFSPYGPATGAMWQSLRQRLVAASAPDLDAKIIEAAKATFAHLHHWMQPVFRSPVSGG